MNPKLRVYLPLFFSDFFEVDPDSLEGYGALNICLIRDLPLFVDPFLLFHSDKAGYKKAHEEVIRYLKFLRNRSSSASPGLIKAWYQFPEVKQNWLGFSQNGNQGSGLGLKFAKSLRGNLELLFSNFGSEKVSRGTHLEKLCLLSDGVGCDSISDFTTNLIKELLLDFTQKFAEDYLEERYCEQFLIPRVRFNYHTEVWTSKKYLLPSYRGDFVILTPKDILTKENTWINRSDLEDKFSFVQAAISNEELRAQVGNYFTNVLSVHSQGKQGPAVKDTKGRRKYRKKKLYITKAQQKEAVRKVLREYPQVLDHFIRLKEDQGNDAPSFDRREVELPQIEALDASQKFADLLHDRGFYELPFDTYEACLKRARFLKHVVEDRDGYRIFYHKRALRAKEEYLQILYDLTWYGSPIDLNREVNNGRGPSDFKASFGALNSNVVEIKLASNSQLKKNLQNQVPIYEKASRTTRPPIKIILFFSITENNKVVKILEELNLANAENIILIDARQDNKPSASKA